MRSYIYRIVSLYREKSQVFWCLIFPIILGTLFYSVFSGLNSEEIISNIPVAVASSKESELADNFIAMLDELEQETDYLEIIYTSTDDAEKMLNNDEIEGIIEIDDSIGLIVKSQGLNQSILKMIVDEYLQMEKTISIISEQNPQGLQAALKAMAQELDLNTETTLGTDNIDTFSQYFYALIAMACLFGSYFGLDNVTKLQANLSALGARRCVAPTSKMKIVITDFLAAVTVHYLNILILIAYLVFILKIDFGSQIGPVLLTCFAGSITGVAMGSMVASISKASEQLKEGFLTAASLVLSFLSGLMLDSMQDIIEHTAPIINRINPAALIKDAFYCLSVYDNYDRFSRNIISLIVVSVIMCTVSIFIMRREKYDSV